jgi:hypothetical protein
MGLATSSSPPIRWRVERPIMDLFFHLVGIAFEIIIVIVIVIVV